MEKRFKALRFVGSLYKVVGIISGAITAISAIGFCIFSILSGSLLDSVLNSVSSSGGGNSAGPAGLFSGILGGLIVGGIILVYGGIAAITLYAAGEGIYLFLAIEENTRTATSLLQQRSGQS
jgi:hypothetical protein